MDGWQPARTRIGDNGVTSAAFCDRSRTAAGVQKVRSCVPRIVRDALHLHRGEAGLCWKRDLDRMGSRQGHIKIATGPARYLDMAASIKVMDLRCDIDPLAGRSAIYARRRKSRLLCHGRSSVKTLGAWYYKPIGHLFGLPGLPTGSYRLSPTFAHFADLKPQRPYNRLARRFMLAAKASRSSDPSRPRESAGSRQPAKSSG